MPQDATVSVERSFDGRAARCRQLPVQNAGYNGDGAG
jgi:hypothetical protein